MYEESLGVRSTNVNGRLKARVDQLQIAPPPPDELRGRAHSVVEQTVRALSTKSEHANFE